MDVVTGIAELRERLRRESNVGLVPTMGNLHAGHFELMKLARKHAGLVVATIFVNRLQFGPSEDFDRYPRTLADDCELLDRAGVDVVFAPAETELYPSPQQIFVEPPAIARELCGVFRPGHFRGVLTVVLKLFNVVQPQVAVFGKKDYQQLQLIRAMIEQLNLPIDIIAAETVREVDGLALSSRNRYLSAAERQEAPRLHAVLADLVKAISSGARDHRALEVGAKKNLDSHSWRMDYVAVRETAALRQATTSDDRLVVLAAGWLGATRLIDNLEIRSNGSIGSTESS